MAHKKAGGSTKNGRDSNSQRRGVKCGDGQLVSGGSIIVRQCGSRVKPGKFTGIGRDYSVYAKVTGRVVFMRRGLNRRLIADVVPV
jgi:large subunit ribosomal protein L27